MPYTGPRAAALVVVAALLTGSLAAQAPRELDGMVDSLLPYVEGAARLRFKVRPKYGWRTEAEIRRYIDRSMSERMGPTRLGEITLAYHLLGLLPDTARYRRGLSNVYVAQLRGLYDPETDTLYCRAGLSEPQVREVLTHELVHALQDQHTDLAALLEVKLENDARFAARATVEGQAMFATLRLLAGGRNLVGYSGLWNWIAASLRLGQGQSSEFQRAPRLLREGLVAPYLYGAQFMSYWQGTELADSAPFGDRMPRSSEQILHPERYVQGDQPLRLRFEDDSAPVITEDVVGEFEIHLLGAQLLNGVTGGAPPAIGWGGDRYRVYRSNAGPALVWYLVWDDPESAAAFGAGTGASLARRTKPGWRASLESLQVDGHAATRYVWAPAAWDGWTALPRVQLVSDSASAARR
ncbi:MAG TPA: hypothetical protein VHJ69_04465 [Gemmatimonadales bacterium]|jgi:hypothetical protein|nr:hypothetical protein [Gemmatimonadales bacterium]